MSLKREDYIRMMQDVQTVDMMVEGKCMVYIGKHNGKPCAMGFRGKSQKPSFKYVFRDENQMTLHCDEFIANCKKIVFNKEKEKLERKFKSLEAIKNIEIGDIISKCCGYSMTYYKFYQIVGYKGVQTVLVQQIGAKVSEVGGFDGYQGNVTPVKDKFLDDEVLEFRAKGDNFTYKGEYAGSIDKDAVSRCYYENHMD